jgi:hypothetical protein
VDQSEQSFAHFRSSIEHPKVAQNAKKPLKILGTADPTQVAKDEARHLYGQSPADQALERESAQKDR